MKKIAVLICLILCVVFIGISQSSKHKFKATVEAKDITLLQATDLEKSLRQIVLLGSDGKPIKIEITVKVND